MVDQLVGWAERRCSTDSYMAAPVPQPQRGMHKVDLILITHPSVYISISVGGSHNRCSVQ